jgi:hypothetical protein
LVVKNGWKTRGATAADTWAVVAHADAQHAMRGIAMAFYHNLGRHPRIDAGLDRISAQIAERLAKQHLVTLDPSELPAHGDAAAARPGLGANLFGGALRDGGHVHRRQRQLGGPREVQEVRDHLSERPVSSRMPRAARSRAGAAPAR